jgi:starch synthase
LSPAWILAPGRPRGLAETPSVVVTHPGKHYHVYQIALAAQQARMLARFMTGVYYQPGTYPYSLLEGLPNRKARQWLRLLAMKRSMEGLDPQLVWSMPYVELATRGFSRLPGLRDVVDPMAPLLLNNALFDRWVSRTLSWQPSHIVHAFFGCAWHSFEAAKKQGRITVLDMPGNPRTYAYVSGEYGRLGGNETAPSVRDRAEIQLADYVFAPSDFVIKDLVACGFPVERVFTIPWAVDTDLFTPGPETSNDAFKILFVGNISLRKGFHFLLEAIKQLQLPGTEVTIIGHPLDKVSEQTLHRYDGLFSWIPRVPYAELPRWYQASDVFVFPSLAEGSAMVTYEAMACGVPVIATENTGSIVRDGRDGFIIPVCDVDAIKEKLEFLYSNRLAARQLGREARRTVEDYTWERYRERVTGAYAQIARERGVS